MGGTQKVKGNNMIRGNPARKKQEGPLKKSSQIPNHLWPSAKVEGRPTGPGLRSWYWHLSRISERRLKLRLAKFAKDSLYRSFKKYIQRKKMARIRWCCFIT